MESTASIYSMVLTFRYRVKNPRGLREMSRAVNLVWNYCGEIQNMARKHNRRWPSKFDLHKLTGGAALGLGVHSKSVRGAVDGFVKARDQCRHRPQWRKSGGSRRSLGWVPFKDAHGFQMRNGVVTVLGTDYQLWYHRPIQGRQLCGNFAEDARGRWFFNVQCEVETDTAHGVGEVALDLGLKALATTSDGDVIENPRHFAAREKELATAQRSGRKTRAKVIHAKIAASRKHGLHNVSAALIRKYETIVVGNVTLPAGKSTLDAGWSMLRSMLRYKAMRHGATYLEVSERLSTQTCSQCGSLGGPKGLEGLGVRSWECVSCGAFHDRDVNAARNILRSGQSAALLVTEKAYAA